MPLERHFEELLVRDVEAHGGFCLKVTAIGRRGFPDRMVMLPGRRPFLVEMKRPGETPTEQQLELHRRLEACGINVLSFDGEKLLW